MNKLRISKVLITGSTGFIGSHLTRRLIDDGFDVGIIKRDDSDTWRISDLLDRLKIYDSDLKDIQGVFKAVSDFKPDVIFHLAAHYTVEHNPQEVPILADTNVLGTLNLLEASKEFKVKLFVNTSSCFVYRESKDKLKEDDDIDPLNLYALTKIHAEEACSFYSKKYGLQCATFRIFPPYGPADHERRLIPYIIKSFLRGEKPNMTTGKQKWDFIYVDDIVNAYIHLLSVPNLSLRHEIFNIGTGNVVRIREIALRLREVLGSNLEPLWKSIPHRKNEVWFMCADISKAKKLLGWEPKTKILESGLELTAEWFKKFWETGGVK